MSHGSGGLRCNGEKRVGLDGVDQREGLDLHVAVLALLTLWTNDVLVSARRIYEAAGFRLEKEEPHHSFGKDLVGQYWQLTL